MGLLPDIEGGKIVEEPLLRLYTPPTVAVQKSDEKRQAELNDLGRRIMAQDYSDHSALDN